MDVVDLYDVLLDIIEHTYNDGQAKHDLVERVKEMQDGTRPIPPEPVVPPAVLAAQKALADAQKALEEAQTQATVTTVTPPLQR